MQHISTKGYFVVVNPYAIQLFQSIMYLVERSSDTAMTFIRGWNL